VSGSEADYGLGTAEHARRGERAQLSAYTPEQMPATHLLYEALHREPVAAGDARCYLCGFRCDARPLVLPKEFMDHARCAGPSMGEGAAQDERWAACAGCAFYWKDGSYRRFGHALITPSTLSGPARHDLAGILFEDPWPAEPYVLVISLAKKKHLIPWAPVNLPGQEPRLLLELTEVNFDRAVLAPVRESFRWLYGRFSKAIIMADEYPSGLLKRLSGIELGDWQLHRTVLRPWIGSAELELISYITLKEGEKDDGGSGADA